MRSKSSTQPVDWTIWLQSQRRRAVTILLQVILGLGALGLVFTIFQAIQLGRFGFNFAYYLTSYLLALFLFYNKRIADEIRGAGFLLVLFTFGVLALYSGWLVSGGRVFLLASVVVATVLVGPRWGLWTALAALLVYAGFVLAYGFNWLELRPLPSPTDFPPMITEGIGFAITLIVVAAGQWLFGQALRAASESNRAAQESRDSFSSIVDRSTDGMIVVDDQGIVRFVNQAAQVFFAQPLKALVGKPFPLEGKPQDGMLLPIWHDDGATGVGDLRIVPTEWHGAPAQLYLVRDVTRPQRAEQESRASQKKFNLAFYNSPLAMTIHSNERGFIEINDAACELLGYSREEQLGKSQISLKLFVDEAVYKQIADLYDSGEMVKNREVRFKRKNGEIRIGLLSSELIEADGEPAFLSSIVDITDLKHAQEAILTANSMLRNYATELETLTNRLMLAARVSRSASEQLDPDKLGEQVVGTIQNEFELYYVGLFLCDDKQEWAELRAATGDAGQKLLSEGHRLAIDDNSMIGWSIKYCEPRIALDVGADAVRFENPLLPDTRSELALPLISRNAVIGAISIQSKQERAFTEENIIWMQNLADLLANALSNARLYDQVQKELKERQLAEAEVRKLNEELEERVRQRTAQLEATNKELEAFSYSVSHDLRAPLRSVDGFSRILMDDFGDQMSEDSRRYVGIIRESAQKMGQLIEDILRLSRISRAELRIETFDLSTYAEEIIKRLREENPDRQVQVEIQSPLVVTGDRNLLVIVLDNLLGNAWKFTSKTPQARITLGMRHEDEHQELFVSDNGVGFDMEYGKKLFGAFQRLHSDQDFPGTGIGLAIVQRIINRHGGRIWAESEPGEGTTFYFTLSE